MATTSPTRARRCVNGWLLVDKPEGLSSSAVVGKARWLTRAAKVGHGGTLDPLATGLLPLALGEATKTVSYVMEGLKRYRFTVRWGIATDTDDAEGRVIGEAAGRPDAASVEAALPAFVGDIRQTPPPYSAIKIEGRRAYALAREKKAVTLAPRPAFIKELCLLAMPDPDHATFEAVCGKGVYMRALARDLADALGTKGSITALRRLSAGPFSVDRAITLEQLAAIVADDALEGALLSVDAALAELPSLPLTASEAAHLRHGRPIAVLPLIARVASRDLRPDQVVYATDRGQPVALARIRGGELRPLRVLNMLG